MKSGNANHRGIKVLIHVYQMLLHSRYRNHYVNELLGLMTSPSAQVGEPNASLVPLGVAGPLCISGTSFHSPSSSLSEPRSGGVGGLKVTFSPASIASLLSGRLSVASVACPLPGSTECRHSFFLKSDTGLRFSGLRSSGDRLPFGLSQPERKAA
jgi:hypothetical protein